MKKKNESLSFLEYRDKYRTPIAVIAARCGLTFHQVYHLFRGGCPTLKTAVTIEKYTDGEVTCEKLLPLEMYEDMKKKLEDKHD